MPYNPSGRYTGERRLGDHVCYDRYRVVELTGQVTGDTVSVACMWCLPSSRLCTVLVKYASDITVLLHNCVINV
jgi:hypothetical protein